MDRDLTHGLVGVFRQISPGARLLLTRRVVGVIARQGFHQFLGKPVQYERGAGFAGAMLQIRRIVRVRRVKAHIKFFWRDRQYLDAVALRCARDLHIMERQRLLEDVILDEVILDVLSPVQQRLGMLDNLDGIVGYQRDKFALAQTIVGRCGGELLLVPV